MKQEHLKIHQACLQLCQEYMRREAPIIFHLQRVEETKLFKKLEQPSLFEYAVKICGLPEGAAYSFIAVGKKAALHPCLESALVSRKITVSKANRIVSIITADNAQELVDFAINNSTRNVEREVRRRNPKAAVKPKIKPLTADTDMLQSPIPRETTENIETAQILLAQKTSKYQGIPETLTLVFKDYVERHDPLRKAQRAQNKKSAQTNSPKPSARAEKSARKYSISKRTDLTAAEKHAVDLRDGRMCTHIGKDGRRCCEKRWIQYHHIIRVADGGSNHPDNIATLCTFHHDLVHQMVLPLEGERSWLRSPRSDYRYDLNISENWSTYRH
ncbi:MAG: HNH endonuclease [Bdellovibrionales bacterium]